METEDTQVLKEDSFVSEFDEEALGVNRVELSRCRVNAVFLLSAALETLTVGRSRTAVFKRESEAVQALLQ
jgi:hypothetical protein